MLMCQCGHTYGEEEKRQTDRIEQALMQPKEREKK